MRPEMRPGMQSLLNLLRGEANIFSVSEQEWMHVLDLAEQENVLPWTAASLRSAVPASMPRLAERLHTIDRNARISTFLWTASLRGTLADFHRRGIPVISLKGPWLAERLYGDAALRSCCDLDLLVHRSDIAVAEDLLTELGFLPSGRRDDYARPFRRGGIKVALSLRASEKKIVIVDAFAPAQGKSKAAAGFFKKLGLKNALVVEASENTNAHRAVRNLAKFNVLAPRGINLESILRHEHLVLTVGAAKEIEGALKS